MELFNQFGIDLHIILAQMLNFGIVLLLLNKFLYKPILTKIKEDEAELNQTVIQKEKLEKDIQIFQTKQQKETAQNKKKSNNIIKEAENIANNLKKETQKNIEETKEQMTRQIQEQIKHQKAKIKNKIEKQYQENLLTNFKNQITDNLPTSILQKWQNIYFDNLIAEINKISFPKSPAASDYKIKFKYSFPTQPEKKSTQKNLNLIIAKSDQLTEGFQYKVKLKHSFPILRKEKSTLIKTLLKQFKVEKKSIKLTTEKSDQLISGFQMETSGILINCNLLNDIKYAAQSK